MSSVEASSASATGGSPPVQPGKMRLEVVVVPVSDVDPANHAGGAHRVSGPADGHADYGSFLAFGDPDGNGWLVQEIKHRLPGR